MNDYLKYNLKQAARQAAHWIMAASRLRNFQDMASPAAWEGLENYVGTLIRQRLLKSIDQLQGEGIALITALNTARSINDHKPIQKRLENFRKHYFRSETMIDFFTDAINTRTNPEIAALLRACDIMARRSMSDLLGQLGKSAPPILTYLQKGPGASILKYGLRLWDGRTENPVAAIKIVRHNLYRPTALIHEAGHDVSQNIGWSEELASVLENGLANDSNEISEMWASWASEIAADTFAFVHTGYAAVAGLHDVLNGGDAYVFRYTEFDPHPIGYIRVLLGTEMCRQWFGAGPWDEMTQAWQEHYPLKNASPEVRVRLQRSLPLIPRIAELCLRVPMRAFGGRAISTLIEPGRVHPESLLQLEREAGPALYQSSHWVQSESLRLLALTGLRAATLPDKAKLILNQQKDWMLRLGAILPES